MTPSKVLRTLAATALSGTLLMTASSLAAADQVRDGQWANQAFDLQKVWSVSKGDGVTVAVIDDGVDPAQPDLTGQVLPEYDPDGASRDRHPSGQAHGTHIASLIAAHGHGAGNADGVVGLAPAAKILPLYKEKGGADAVPEDIRWAVDHGAKVVNISQGKAGNPSPELSDAVAYAADHNVLVVAATGNDGSAVETPASAPGVLAVGAVDKSLTIWDKSNHGPQVLLTAPGVDIVGAGNGQAYNLGSGTSDAVAYVSAAAALVWSKYPQLTAGQVANRLVKTAAVPDQLKAATLPDPHYGYGIIRPYEALKQDIPPGPAQGPLSKPVSSGNPGANSVAPVAGSSSREFPVLAVVLGGGLLVALLIVVVVAVAIRNRRRPLAAPSVQPTWQQPGQVPYGAPPAPGQQPYQNQPWQQHGGHEQR